MRGLISLSMAVMAVMHTETAMSSVLMLGAVTLTTMGLSYFASLFMDIFFEWDLLLNCGSRQANYRINQNAPVRLLDCR